MIPPCLFCDPVASSCCIDSVRKPTGIRAIVEEVTTSPKESDNRRLGVEQSIGVLGKSTPDMLRSGQQLSGDAPHRLGTRHSEAQKPCTVEAKDIT